MKAITGATMIDGTGSAPIAGGVALVEGADIIAAGSAQSVPVPEDADIIDATGMTLLPGLIDTHDHLASFSYEIASRWGYHRAAQRAPPANCIRPPADARYGLHRRARRRRSGRRLPHGCGRRACAWSAPSCRAGLHHAHGRHGGPRKSARIQAARGRGFRLALGASPTAP